MPSTQSQAQHWTARWSALFLATLVAAFGYAFMEWLFIRTKPSFMDALSLPASFEIFIFSGAWIAGLGSLAMGLLWAASRLPGLRHQTHRLIQIGVLLPAGLLAVLALLMIDNFTYSLFEYGIVLTRGWVRGLYAAGFALLLVGIYRWLWNALPHWGRRIQGWQRSRVQLWLVPGCLGMIALGLAIPWLRAERGIAAGMRLQDQQARTQRPHILLLIGDGINANRLSAYGYQRETSPTLKALAESSLVAENAYTNSAYTSGSIIAMFTGKPPAETRLFFPPNVLRGKDMYQHLPGMLRSTGYRSIQISMQFYIDAYELRLQNGFDYANNRSIENTGVFALLDRYLPVDPAQFLRELITRASGRLLHIFFIQDMPDVYRQITEPARGYNTDHDRADLLLQMLEDADQPVFAHAHFLGTHGQTFAIQPEQQVFSKGKDPYTQGQWDDDFYDDAILQFDQLVAYLIAELKAKGLYDQTILIIASDHGQRSSTIERIPLIMHFPNDAYRGRIRQSVQALDIAPTLLDYLGMAQPDWMGGVSLLQGEPPERPIFAPFTVFGAETVPGQFPALNPEKIKPPFFQFGSFSLIHCNRWYHLQLVEFSLSSDHVAGATAPCADETALTDQKALRLFINYLKDNHFDVSTLRSYAQDVARSGNKAQPAEQPTP